MKRFRELLLAAGLTAGGLGEGCATPPNRPVVEAGAAYNKPSSSKKPELEPSDSDIGAKLEEQREKAMIDSYAVTVRKLDVKINEMIGFEQYSARVMEGDRERVQNLQEVLELLRRAIIIHSYIECHIIIDTNKNQTNFTKHVLLRSEEGVQQAKIEEIYGPLVEAEKALKDIFKQKLLSLIESAKNSLREFDQSSLTFEGYADSSQAVDSLGRQAEYISSLQELIDLYIKFVIDRQMVFMVDERVMGGPNGDVSGQNNDTKHFIIR